MAGNGDTPTPDEERPDDDELARRLRDLDWPKPPPGVKERSLEELERKLREQEDAAVDE